MKKTHLFLLASIVTMTIGGAQAQFTLVPMARTPQAEAPRDGNASAPGRVMSNAAPAPQYFAAPNDTTLAQGFGVDVPLVFALQQIVPSPWRVSIPEADLNRIVSWQGGAAWPQAVEKLAASIGMTVAWGQGLVYLHAGNQAPSTAASTPSTLSAPSVAASTPAALPPPPAPVASVPAAMATPFNPPVLQAQATAAPATQIWSVTPGSFRSVLRDWAQRAKWNVIFIGDIDYEIESGATFTGEFVEAASALVRAFRATDRPSTITFYKDNNTAVVRSTMANGD